MFGVSELAQLANNRHSAPCHFIPPANSRTEEVRKNMAAGTNVSEMIAKMNKVDLKDQDEKNKTAEEGKDGKQAEVDKKKEAGRTHKDSTTNRSNSGRRVSHTNQKI